MEKGDRSKEGAVEGKIGKTSQEWRSTKKSKRE